MSCLFVVARRLRVSCGLVYITTLFNVSISRRPQSHPTSISLDLGIKPVKRNYGVSATKVLEHELPRLIHDAAYTLTSQT